MEWSPLNCCQKSPEIQSYKIGYKEEEELQQEEE